MLFQKLSAFAALMVVFALQGAMALPQPGSSDGTSSILDNLEENGGTAAGVVIGKVILPKKTTDAGVKAVGGSIPDHKD